MKRLQKHTVSLLKQGNYETLCITIAGQLGLNKFAFNCEDCLFTLLLSVAGSTEELLLLPSNFCIYWKYIRGLSWMCMKTVRNIQRNRERYDQRRHRSLTNLDQLIAIELLYYNEYLSSCLSFNVSSYRVPRQISNTTILEKLFCNSNSKNVSKFSTRYFSLFCNPTTNCN